MIAGDGFDRLVRDWTGHAERWARHMDRCCPGADFWPAAARALHGAAATFDPAGGASFFAWFRGACRHEMRGEYRTWRRRRRRLTRHDLARLRGAAGEPGGLDPGFARAGDADALLAVLAALDALPEREATPIRRRYLGGEPIRAIARSRMVRAATVADDIRRGLATLRAELSGA